MAALLTTATANTVGALVSHTGPSSVFVTGTPGGARVILQISPTSSTAAVVKPDNAMVSSSIFVNRTGSCSVDAQGTYFLRAVLENAGPTTSITVTTTP